MSVTLAFQVRQQLALTPRLQQSLRLLQLSSLEFEQELQQALDTNPFLENSQTDDEAVVSDTNTAQPNSAEVTALADALPHSEASYSAHGLRSESRSDIELDEWSTAEPSLRAHLHEMLRLYPLHRRDRAAAHLIVDALDDDGYLRQTLSDLTRVADPALLLTEQDLAVALRLIQSLDRPGIAARSLSECLLLQLEAMPVETPALAYAKAIASRHLESLARRETAEIGRQLGCDTQMLHAACALVRKLDPRPGEYYGNTRGDYVVPDVIVRQLRGEWVVITNPAVMPRAQLHRHYAELFAQSSGAYDSPLGQQLQEARWMLRNMQKRFDTIQRVGACIVARQSDFFRYGEIAMKPLVLRDIAEELQLHESTISRATGNKYMATPHGTFEFKYFFPRRLEAADKNICSSATAKALIGEMIRAEQPAQPLSDVTLTQRLAEHGIMLARRTVTKYRQALKFPPAELRRHDQV